MTNKIVYEYDQNRVFTQQREVTPTSVLSPNSTFIAPPTTEGFHIFDGVKWFTRDEYPHPPAPTPEPEVRRITRLAFLSRFTDAEAIAIDLASIGNSVYAATLRRYLNKIDAATFIDLSVDELRLSLKQLEYMSIIQPGRADQIIDAPIQDVEKPL